MIDGHVSRKTWKQIHFPGAADAAVAGGRCVVYGSQLSISHSSSEHAAVKQRSHGAVRRKLRHFRRNMPHYAAEP